MSNEILYEVASRLAQQCDCLGYDSIDIDIISKINKELGHKHIDLTNQIKREIPSYLYETHIQVAVVQRPWRSRVFFKKRNNNMLGDEIDFDRVEFEVIEDISMPNIHGKKNYIKRLIVESPWPIDDKKALIIVKRALCIDLSNNNVFLQIASSHHKNY